MYCAKADARRCCSRFTALQGTYSILVFSNDFLYSLTKRKVEGGKRRGRQWEYSTAKHPLIRDFMGHIIWISALNFDFKNKHFSFLWILQEHRAADWNLRSSYWGSCWNQHCQQFLMPKSRDMKTNCCSFLLHVLIITEAMTAKGSVHHITLSLLWTVPPSGVLLRRTAVQLMLT